MARRGERSDSLDAVRGTAILLVVSFHWFGMPLGWTGVDLFFVLSGYLIGGILIDNRESPTYFSTFYARRTFRIVPLYLVFLSMAACLTQLASPVWRYLTFTQNFAWVDAGLSRVGITGLTWSLAVEEQFYLVLPVLAWMLSKRALMSVSICLIALAPICRWLLIDRFGPFAPYLMLPGRMDTLFAGVLIACVVRNPLLLASARRCRRLVLLASGAALTALVILGIKAGFSSGSRPMYLFGYTLIMLVYAGSVLSVVTREELSLSHRVLCSTGIGAYAIYLFHQAILAEAIEIFGSGTPIALFAAILGTVAAAMLCWIGIERPSIRFARARWNYGTASAKPTIVYRPAQFT